MDGSCVEFLRWALPRMGLAWPGFRRVRRQVCRCISMRLRTLNLGDCGAYRRHLDQHPEEWPALDACCRIPISRFFRDAPVFEALGSEILPQLAADALADDAGRLRIWSAGCAAGEEPYTLGLVWHLTVAPRFPDVVIEIVATDADPHQLERAATACYRASSLKELGSDWIERAFTPSGPMFCLKPPFRQGVRFEQQDMRREMPAGPFRLVLCRNLAFTYFAPAEQALALRRLMERLAVGGALVVGVRESVPRAAGLAPWGSVPGAYRRLAG